ncbi:unknown protein [Seminavis robusta]|uniref:Uncharacterized protein n=1 Tax=Seminavis robusta TaxID=568900 RepID=A0A9N8E7T6_9STRA|nr:unknown protein [Seminavis robusta]|eukprot:Sro775_g200830.1 n/a (278) ;mRNA; r:26877-27710
MTTSILLIALCAASAFGMAAAVDAPYNSSYTNSSSLDVPVDSTGMSMSLNGTTSNSTSNSMTSNSITPTPTPSTAPSTTYSLLEGMQGALVTRDCLFANGVYQYPYAIDIFWSCGDERFQEPLRLHTFKRHSRPHKLVFADQLLTYRDQQRLWFDAYNIPRCIRVMQDDDKNSLQVTSNADACASFDFLPILQSDNIQYYHIQEISTGKCMGLGSGNDCNSDESTGGSECGGVDHRFLPLVLMEDSCNTNSALAFAFETQAQDCANNRQEFPANSCF